MRVQSVVIHGEELDDDVLGCKAADTMTIETEDDDSFVQITLETNGDKMAFYCKREMLLLELVSSRQFATRCQLDNEARKVKP